jgi:hypothetical protein
MHDNGKLVKVKVDFAHAIPKANRATVWIWHDAADACGSLCDLNVEFLKAVADVEIERQTPGTIDVRPRFIFQDCPKDAASKSRCTKACTVNQKCVPLLFWSPPPSPTRGSLLSGGR